MILGDKTPLVFQHADRDEKMKIEGIQVLTGAHPMVWFDNISFSPLRNLCETQMANRVYNSVLIEASIDRHRRNQLVHKEERYL